MSKEPETCCGDPEDCQHFLSGLCPNKENSNV